MAEPIRLTIQFDASGRPIIREAISDLNTLAASARSNVSAYASGGRALRQFEQDVNRVSSALQGRLSSAIGVAASGFTNMVRLAESLGRTGFYTLIGGATAATAVILKMGKGFLDVNEQFQNLEITLRSTFKNLSIARDLREELVKITAISPIPFTQLADVARTFSVLPQTRGAIALQSSQGTLADQNGFFRRAEKLVEQMIAFRPDKTAEDAIFSIREALSGQFRSLVRRFDIPLRYLAQAGGTTSDKLKNDSGATFEALTKLFGSIISPAAITEYTKQPTILIKNLKEQLLEIPALLIGGNGKEGIYTTLLTKINSVYEILVNFVSSRIQPYATRISKALDTLFTTFGNMGTKVTDFFLHKLNLGSSDRTDLTLADRIAEGVTQLVERGTAALPNFLDRVGSFFKTLLPILETFTKVVIKIIDIFTQHPIASLLAYSQIGTIPAMIRGAFGGGFSRIGSLSTLGQTQASLNPTASSVSEGFMMAFRNIQARQGAFPGFYALSNLFNQNQQPGGLSSYMTMGATGRYRLNTPTSSLTPQQLAAFGIAPGTPGRPFISNATAQNVFNVSTVAAGARASLGGALGGAALGAAGIFSSVIAPMAIMAGVAYALTKAFQALEEHTQKAADSMRDFANRTARPENETDRRRQSSVQFAANLQQALKGGVNLPAFNTGETNIHNPRFIGIGEAVNRYTEFNNQLEKINEQINSGSKSESEISQLIKQRERLNVDIDQYGSRLTKYFNDLGAVFPTVLTEKQQALQYGVKEAVEKLLDREYVFGTYMKDSLGQASKTLSAIPVEGKLPFYTDLENFLDATKKQLNPSEQISQDLKALAAEMNNMDTLQASFEKLRNAGEFRVALDKDLAGLGAVYDKVIGQLKDYSSRNIEGDKARIDVEGKSTTIGEVIERLSQEAKSAGNKAGEYLNSITQGIASSRKVFDGITNEVLFFRVANDLIPHLEKATSREEGQRMIGEFKASTAKALEAFTTLPDNLSAGLDFIAKDLLEITPDKSKKRLSEDFEQARALGALSKFWSDFGDYVASGIEQLSKEFSTKFSQYGPTNNPEALKLQSIIADRQGLLGRIRGEGSKAAGSAETAQTVATNRFNTEDYANAASNVERLLKDLTSLRNDSSGDLALKQLEESLIRIGNPDMAAQIERLKGVLKLDSDDDILHLAEKIKVVNPLLESYAKDLKKAADEQKDAKNLTQSAALMSQMEGLIRLHDDLQKKLEGFEGKGGMLGSLLDGWKSVMDGYKETSTNFKDIGKGVAESISSSFGQAFDSIITKSKSAGDAFRDMGLSMLRTLANLLAQKAITNLLGYVFGSPAGAAVGAFSNQNVGFGTATGSFGKSYPVPSGQTLYRPVSASKNALVAGGENVPITININEGGAGTPAASGGKGIDVNALQRVVRASVIQELQRQKRVGGVLH
jgi:hypothetical protein